jgi:hypothetical protein
MPDQVAAYTEVDICNLALAELGRGSQIADIDEASQSARMCKLRYPYARDATLRAFDWNFASARTVLQPTGVVPAFEYENTYTLPTDCLQVRAVYMGEDCMWTIEERNLLANWGGDLQLKYTKLVTDPKKFDTLFVSALACRLAAEIANTLTESTTRAEGMWKAYNAKLLEARKRDSQETQPDQFPLGSWIESRYR